MYSIGIERQHALILAVVAAFVVGCAHGTEAQVHEPELACISTFKGGSISIGGGTSSTNGYVLSGAGVGWFDLSTGDFCVESGKKISKGSLVIEGPKVGNLYDQQESSGSSDDCSGVVRIDNRTGIIRLETDCEEAMSLEDETVVVRRKGGTVLIRFEGYTGTLQREDETEVVSVVFRLGDGPDNFPHLSLIGYTVVRFEDFVGRVRFGDGTFVYKDETSHHIKLGGGVLGIGSDYFVLQRALFYLQEYTGVVRFESE